VSTSEERLGLDMPGKVVCVGLNYRDHAEEGGQDVPASPLIFAKWPSSLIGNGVPIRIPCESDAVDYEAELAVVIGRRAVDLRPEQALEVIAGFTCFNDVTARDVQQREGQWTRAKSFNTFGPIGPKVVPVDQAGDHGRLTIRCLLNGEVVQESSTAEMIFGIADVLAFISRSTTLEPGDIIATGTPAGVGFSQQPPRLLREGDEVSVEIENIGVLTNPVVASPSL
jgi:2-keto-4-pentenoate hydratase/2-oxohepta-3-ene-1,7-dioic acid hydratase in catechol pathway